MMLVVSQQAAFVMFVLSEHAAPQLSLPIEQIV